MDRPGCPQWGQTGGSPHTGVCLGTPGSSGSTARGGAERFEYYLLGKCWLLNCEWISKVYWKILPYLSAWWHQDSGDLRYLHKTLNEKQYLYKLGVVVWTDFIFGPSFGLEIWTQTSLFIVLPVKETSYFRSLILKGFFSLNLPQIITSSFLFKRIQLFKKSFSLPPCINKLFHIKFCHDAYFLQDYFHRLGNYKQYNRSLFFLH